MENRLKIVFGLFIAYFLILFESNAQQSIVLKGIVRDSLSKVPLPFANVVLQDINDNAVILAFTTTNERGAFELEVALEAIQVEQPLFLKISMLGYKMVTHILPIKEAKKTLYFYMKEESFVIKEVVIMAGAKIIQKKDTIVYSADAFRDSTERNLEELLAKMPGIDVSEEGKIFVQGQEIQKILIDGDDMSGKNYQIMSKNLSADIVNKVQVLNKFSENYLLRKVTDSQSKAINITIKKEKQNILNKSARIGIGNDNRQDHFLELTGIYSKFKTVNFCGYNTVGKQATIYAYETQDDGLTNGSLLHANPSKFLTITENSAMIGSLFVNRFNKEGGFTTRWVLNPLTRLKVISWFSFSKGKNETYKSSEQEYRFNDSTFQVKENTDFRYNYRTLEGRTELFFTINQNSAIKVSTKFWQDINQKQVNQSINNAKISNYFEAKNFTSEHRINYTKQFNDSLAFTSDVYYLNYPKNEVLKFLSSSPQSLFNFILLSNSFLVQQAQNSFQFFGANGQIFLKRNSQIFTAKLSQFYRLEHPKTDISPIEIDSLQNNFLFSQKNTNLKFTYKKQYASIIFLFDSSIGFYHATKMNMLASKSLYALPTIGIKKENTNQNLSLTYSYNLSLPQLLDISTGYTLSNYRTFMRGSNLYIPTNNHTIIFDYAYNNVNNFNSLTNYHFNSIINFGKNGYLNDLHINDIYFYNTKQPNKISNESYLVRAGVERYFPTLAISFKVKPSFNASTYQNILNNLLRKTEFYTANLDISLRSGFLSGFNFAFGIAPSQQYSHTKISDNLYKTRTKSVGSYLDVYLKIKNFDFKLETEYFRFKNDSHPTQGYFFLSGSMDYKFKKQGIDVSLRANNILNTKEFITNFINDYVIAQNSIKLLPRYLLLQVGFHL